LFQFERNLAVYCKKRGYDGVICGHIHHAEIKEINGVTYMNDGDWVESCTALVEHHDGRWEIVTWTKESDHVDTDNTGGASKQSKRHSGKGNDRISYPPGVRASTINNDQLVKI
jgi:4-hydroxy-3-methylbut-2-enyl diphosphate reductase IspH